jgi:peptide/nickel transport system ATP-binding protein
MLLETHDLTVEYGEAERAVTAVHDVNLTLAPGEFLAVVGESGCGKSTLCFAIAQLLPPAGRIVTGDVMFKGTNLVSLRENRLRHIRWRDYSVVMQSAMNALNPVLTIGEQLRDALAAHERISKKDARRRAAEALQLVGVASAHIDSYPHQLSGGMRQRALIAMALLFTADLLIMDEPTSALDVVAQRALMSEIKQLQERIGFAVLFVTHDISLVSRFSDRVAVMYAGQLVELNRTENLFGALHPYTVALLESFPSVSQPKLRLQGIPGNPPDLRALPAGCPFSPRCKSVMPQCHTVEPKLLAVREALVRCHLYDSELGPDGD